MILFTFKTYDMKQLEKIFGLSLLRRISWKARIALVITGITLMAMTADNAPIWFLLINLLSFLASSAVLIRETKDLEDDDDDE